MMPRHHITRTIKNTKPAVVTAAIPGNVFNIEINSAITSCVRVGLVRKPRRRHEIILA